jgi:hypothetical protein
MTGLRWVACVGLILTGLALPAAAGQKEGKLERPFAPGRHLWMDLSSGNYIVQAGADDKVVVRWDTTDPDSQNIKVSLDARGPDAAVITQGESGHFRIIVEVPARTDITSRLSAGDFRIQGISGNKDISSWAGNVVVEVGRPEEYRTVSASVTAGDLDASAFDVKKGGLFRSFSWKGPGTYKMEVRLTAGDLRLTR